MSVQLLVPAEGSEVGSEVGSDASEEGSEEASAIVFELVSSLALGIQAVSRKLTARRVL